MPENDSQEAKDSDSQQQAIVPGFAKEAFSDFNLDDWKELDSKFNELFKDT